MNIPFVANANIANAGLRSWLLSLHESVADRGVRVLHVALAAAIGQGRPASEPDVIADAYWTEYKEGSRAELFYLDMPDADPIELSDKFITDNSL